MQKFLLPLCLAALAVMPAYGQAPASAADDNGQAHSLKVLTLPDALLLAMSANPAIAVALRELDAYDGMVRQAGIPPNPELAALVEDTGRATRTTTVQVNQAIELGGKRLARIRAAERSRDAAAGELRVTQADVRSTVIAVFYEVLVAQEKNALAKSTLELAQRATTVVSKRVAAGKVSPVEETKAKVAEYGVRAELAQAAHELANARRRLAATWGATAPHFERVDGQIAALPSIGPYEELIARLARSPRLMRARNELARRAAMADVEKSRRIPDLTLNLGARRDEQLGRTQAVVGIAIPLPVFDRNQGNLLEALSREEKARAELKAAKVQLSNELLQSRDRFITSRREVELLQSDILPGAQRAYDAATTGYEYGKFGFMDVLDAQRTLIQAKSQYLHALADAHRAAAEIERILGGGEPGKQEQK